MCGICHKIIQRQQQVMRSAISDLETQIRSAHKILVGNFGVKRSLRKLKPIRGDNIKMDLTDI
jgi:hypothetical protein